MPSRKLSSKPSENPLLTSLPIEDLKDDDTTFALEFIGQLRLISQHLWSVSILEKHSESGRLEPLCGGIVSSGSRMRYQQGSPCATLVREELSASNREIKEDSKFAAAKRLNRMQLLSW